MEIVSIQDSFEDVLQDVENGLVSEENVWVSFRSTVVQKNQNLIYLTVTKDGIHSTSDVVSITPRGHQKYSVAKGDQNYELQFCSKKFEVSNSRASSVAISSDGLYLIVGYTNGNINIYNLTRNTLLHQIEDAHLSDITSLSFFPSNKVFLSISLDLTLKIWSIEGKNVRALKYQKKEISSVFIMGDTGRNLLTGSLDGSVCLWECGSGNMMHMFSRIQDKEDPVCTMLVLKEECDTNECSKYDFETQNKALFVGYESGIIQKFSIGGRYQTRTKFQTADSAGVRSLVSLDRFLVAGYANGYIRVWNLDSDSLVSELQVGSESVTKMSVGASDKGSSLYVACGSDFLGKFSIDSTGIRLDSYFVGRPENSKVHDLSCCDGILVAAVDEGCYFYSINY